MKLFHFLCVAFFITGCATAYPQNWWKEVPAGEAKSWEILPQAAKQGEVILSKRTELGVFSNFAPTPFVLDGKSYASLEGFWQSLKYPENKKDPRWKLAQWPYSRENVEQMVGFDAKKAGDFANQIMKKNKMDWVTYQGKKINYRENKKGEFYNLIRRATVAKLEQNPEVKTLLLKTGNLKLLPDHHQKPDSPPAWRYYEIYTDLRGE